MIDNGHDPVGSVAEEAARLIGLFAAGLPEAQLRAAGARAAGEAGEAPPSEHVCPECGHDPHAASTFAAQPSQPPSVCRVCPVCRVLNVVRSISPETLDRIADIVDLVSDGLRGFATNRREQNAPAAASPGGSAAPAAQGAGDDLEETS